MKRYRTIITETNTFDFELTEDDFEIMGIGPDAKEADIRGKLCLLPYNEFDCYFTVEYELQEVRK